MTEKSRLINGLAMSYHKKKFTCWMVPYDIVTHILRKVFFKHALMHPARTQIVQKFSKVRLRFGPYNDKRKNMEGYLPETGFERR